MSDFENPYQSPQASVVPETPLNTGVSISGKMLNYLYEASPWLRFIGILGFISCGFIVVIGILIAAIGSLVFSMLGDEFRYFPSWIFALIYFSFGVLVFSLSYFTYNFGKKIRNFRFSNSAEDLEEAFKNNKSLWKFLGIICIINLSVTPLLLVFSVIGGVAALINGL